MSVESCVTKINQAIQRGRLKKSDIKEIVQMIDDEAKRVQGQGKQYQDAVRDAGIRLRNHLERMAKEEKRRALLHLRAYQKLSSKIDRLTGQGMTSREAVVSLISGLRKEGVEGSMESTGGKQADLMTRYQNDFLKAMQKEGVLDVFRSKDEAIQLDILEAIEAYNTKGSDRPSGAYGKIAEIYSKHLKIIRERMRRAGVDTREIDGFTVTQMHSTDMMVIKGSEEWKDNIRNKLDYKKIFGTEDYAREDIEAFLENSYDAMSTGVRKQYKRSSKDVEDDVVQMARPRNMAEKIASSRVLHFKSARDFFEYNKEFGIGNIQSTIMQMMSNMGRDIALIEDFGPNPRANFEKIIKKEKVRLRDIRDTKQISELDDRSTWAKLRGLDIEALYNNLDGSAYAGTSSRSARIGQNIRGWVSMSKLGGATISALSDIPIAAEVMANNSINHAESYINAFSSSVKRLPESERAYFASAVDTFQENTVGAIAKRFGLFDERPGKMAEALRIYFKANGLQWWTSAKKEGVMAALSNNIANRSQTGWAELPSGLKSSLSAFGFKKIDWDIIGLLEPDEIRGKKYITLDTIDGLENLKIAKYLGITDNEDPQISKIKQDLGDKLNRYYIETVNTAVVTPGLRERAITNFGARPGTFEGEFARTVMLFKSFPITFTIKVLGPSVAKARNGDVRQLLALVAGMTAFGGVALSAKDLLKGRDPMYRINQAKEDPTKAARVAMQYMMQGGGGGIYGDFLLGEYNRYGGSLTQTLAGPVYGEIVTSIGRLYSDIKDVATGEEDVGRIGASIIQSVKNNIPGGNLPYIAPALNYLFIYQMQEALNPGYLRRMEKRAERDYGYQYLQDPIDLRPSTIVK